VVTFKVRDMKDTDFKKKEIMINAILTAVNNNINGKRADANMFFSLVFMTNKQLMSVCKEAGIKINFQHTNNKQD